MPAWPSAGGGELTLPFDSITCHNIVVIENMNEATTRLFLTGFGALLLATKDYHAISTRARRMAAWPGEHRSGANPRGSIRNRPADPNALRDGEQGREIKKRKRYPAMLAAQTAKEVGRQRSSSCVRRAQKQDLRNEGRCQVHEKAKGLYEESERERAILRQSRN